MNKKPVRANLFRFVTLRNPQLIAEEDKDQGFVFYPNQSKSAFHTAVEGLEDSAKTAALAPVVAGFSPLKTKSEVRSQDSALYSFATWLMRNKNELTYAAVYAKIDRLAPLSSANELKLWDNLIYQTLERKSMYVRESIIQTLIANKFLKAFLQFSDGMSGELVFTDEQEKEFVRRANASVVIDKDVFVRAKDSTDRRRRVSKRVRKAIAQDLQVALSKERAEKLKALSEELLIAEMMLSKEDQKAYDIALTAYDAQVDQLVKTTVPVLKDVVNPKTGLTESIETFPDLEIPKFDYQTPVVIDDRRLGDQLSPEAMSLFNQEELLKFDTFEEVQKQLTQKVEVENNIVFNAAANTPKKISVGGAVLQVSDQSRVPAADFNISPIGLVTPTGSSSIHMQIFDELDGASIVSANYGISFHDRDYTEGTDFTMLPSRTTTVRLFPEGVAFPSPWQSYTLSGTFVLDDGRSLNFNVNVVAKATLNLGDFTAVDSQGDGSGDSQKPLGTRQVFGVTNLGIADFRRVEQEVCCYVPGEVSHIENILAREYKERSTRSLTSAETTTEETSEREVENLKDTSTTERFEMQSEASSVINEDSVTDVGANAGVNGNFGNVDYFANAFFNNSSASSTSHSNSQAQTYAEEVTERALERVVEKVSRKRTSRVLQEFEETNKHGFDNTKGDKHITGVYRWVDKIYNNSLVNYGKRLMYEFAIPEPSKFFKEAVDMGMEKSDTGAAVEVPVAPAHPRTFDINSASDITPENYRNAAGYYNAEVNAAPQAQISVSDSFSVIGNQYIVEDHHGGASSFKMAIPEGYEVITAKSTLGFSYVPHEYEDTYGAMTVGHHYTDIRRAKNDKVVSNYDFTASPVKDELGIAFHGTDVGGASIGIVAVCRRTTESFKQWQNETFNAIMSAYEDKLAAYKDEKAAQVEPTEETAERLRFNPLFNRSIEKKEIKRIAIELMTEGLSQKVSQNNYENEDPVTGISEVNKGEKLQSHIAMVKFFEQAFDWDIMAYLFYPYFYANKKDWKNLFQETEAADPIFQAFLQSGMARAVVPVKPGFEHAMNWFMETGELWEGQNLVMGEETDRYMSIAEELETTQGVVEKTWESRVPTALTIVQAESASLIEGGLPCFCPDETKDSTIQTSVDILGNATASTEPATLEAPAPVR